MAHVLSEQESDAGAAIPAVTASGLPVAGKLVLHLPAEMASPHYQRIAKVTGEWREVFPGLQVSMPGFGAYAYAEAVILFRLTPADGDVTPGT